MSKNVYLALACFSRPGEKRLVALCGGDCPHPADMDGRHCLSDLSLF